MARRRRAAGLDRRGVRRDDARARRDSPPAGAHVLAPDRDRLRQHVCAQLDVRVGDPADLHRPLRCGRVSDAAVQHRRRGTALRRRDPRRGGRHCARRPVELAVGVGDDRRRDGRWRGARSHSRNPACLPEHERDHHLADAQLHRRARPRLPHLRLALLLARHLDAEREGVSAGEDPSGRRDVAGDPRRRARAAVRAARRHRRCRLRVGALHAHPVRVRGAGDRRLAASRQTTRGCARAARSSR